MVLYVSIFDKCYGTTDWFQIGKGVCQDCILSPCLFNLYVEYIMRNAGLDTYMPYGNNKMAYLSTIKDSSTNEILAYNLSNNLAIDIVTETINKLVKLRSFKLHKDAFIHSDQGSHYTSPIFQKLLKKYNLGQSMSRRGNCWDNAPQESFFGHMKDEIDYKSCETIEELKILIDDYMDYYNNERCQWNLKKLTPVQYRNQLLVTS